MRGQQRITAALAAGLALGLLGGLGGCACPPQTDFGKAYTIVNQNQILNREEPAAGPVEGLDGVKAENAMDSYRKPPAPQTGGDNGLFLKLGSPLGSTGASGGK
jgi:hypothetical protein